MYIRRGRVEGRDFFLGRCGAVGEGGLELGMGYTVEMKGREKGESYVGFWWGGGKREI